MVDIFSWIIIIIIIIIVVLDVCRYGESFVRTFLRESTLFTWVQMDHPFFHIQEWKVACPLKCSSVIYKISIFHDIAPNSKYTRKS